MKVEALHIGQKVRHPQHGIGIVKALTEQSADIQFDDLKRTISPQTSDIQPAEVQATINGLEVPLARFVDEIVAALRARANAPNLSPKEIIRSPRGSQRPPSGFRWSRKR